MLLPALSISLTHRGCFPQTRPGLSRLHGILELRKHPGIWSARTRLGRCRNPVVAESIKSLLKVPTLGFQLRCQYFAAQLAKFPKLVDGHRSQIISKLVAFPHAI